VSKCRRVAGLVLCLVVVTMAVLGGWSSRPPVNAADTVDLPAGFLDAPENVEFLRSLTIPQDKLELVLSMRDTAEEGQPPFWAEVQALMIVEQERKQWEWALTETGAEHTFRDAVKQMKPILDLYLFLSKASVGWAYGSSSLPGIIGDYLRVKKWVSTWKAVVNAGKVIENFKNLPARSRNEFIWWSAQEDVEVFSDNRYTLSLLAPEMDSEEGMALAHHIYIVLQEDIEADKQELADKLFDLARQSGVTITGLRQFQADGTTSIAVGGAVTGGELVVSATVGSPSAPVRLEVVTRPPGTLSAGSRNYESPYGPGGKTSLTISLDAYLPGEYVWLARACDQNGGASVWTSFGDNLSWNADFVLGAATGTLTAPTLKSVKPKADGASPGIVLEWTPVAGADNYEIYRDNLLLHTTRPPGTTFWNTGLTPGQSYSYRVRARSGYQFGPLSAGVSAVAPPPDLSATQPRVVVDSNPVPLDVAPTNVSGSLLVPIRAISEALGAQVGWDQASQTVTLTLGGTVVKLVLGSKQATVNGKTVALTAAAANVDGRILVPLRFVGESFGAEVAWKQETQTVVIIGRREGASEVATAGLPVLAAGFAHSLAIAADGTVWAWGHNQHGDFYGVLGVGERSQDSPVPAQVQGLAHAIAVAAGTGFSVVLCSDGTVWSWGGNDDGELGDGTRAFRSTPEQVEGLVDVVAVAAGYHHAIALCRDGTVWAWGSNRDGQLGDGTTPDRLPDRLVPVQVKGLADVVTVAASGNNSAAICGDGTLWIWGNNEPNQTGYAYDYHTQGTYNVFRAPVQVQGLSDVTAVEPSAAAAALRRDGTVWVWGRNFYGQPTDRAWPARLTPVQVQELSAVVAIDGDNGRTVALCRDGTVWEWGYNGDNLYGRPPMYRTTPMRVQELSDVVAVGVGSNHNLALRRDGTVWAWGDNGDGELGDGTTTDRSTPVQVQGLPDVGP